ncbi:protein kinase domain-containing protein [Microbispora sp. H13382]|uniref:serine/threonine-protein kinase n=1 Tax=Microbispora sp. H13382 TaxID=2729112 RepID=UPI001604681C|nr:protein kinase [Microbispora sp. H13382]
MSPAGNTQPLRPNDPRTIGGYTITDVLGQGGQRVVYLGTAPGGGKVAVKVLHARFSAGDRERLLREAAIARRVAAFCTARVLDAGITEGQAYVVSEFVDGGSLEELVRQEGPRDEGGLTRLALATLTALSAVHAAGIVHRDLKPRNILLGPEGPDLTGVPDFLRPLLARCLAKDPGERPAITDLLSALTRNATASAARPAAAPAVHPGRTLRVTRRSPFLHRVHWPPRARWGLTAGIVATGGAITVFAAAALVPRDSVSEPDDMPAAVQVQPPAATTPTVLSLPVSSPLPSPSEPASPPPSPSTPEEDVPEEDEQIDDEQTDDVRAEETAPTWSLTAAGRPWLRTRSRGHADRPQPPRRETRPRHRQGRRKDPHRPLAARRRAVTEWFT